MISPIVQLVRRWLERLFRRRPPTPPRRFRAAFSVRETPAIEFERSFSAQPGPRSAAATSTSPAPPPTRGTRRTAFIKPPTNHL